MSNSKKSRRLADKTESHKVIQEISQLYELSLAVGQSLNLKENCDTFLKTLLARKSLSSAAVWIKTDLVDNGKDKKNASLIYLNPEYRKYKTVIPLSHPIFKLLKNKDYISVASSEKEFSKIAMEKNLKTGTFALFALGEIGILQLYSATMERPFDSVELNQLKNVISKFTISIEGSLSHLRVKQEIEVRERAEEEIIKLSSAVEQSPSIVVITDTEGNIEFVNPKFTKVTGYTSDEVIGKNPRILKSGETSQEEYKHMWKTITSGKAWWGEFHNKKKNGEFYWEYASISPIKDSKGKIIHFLAVKEDITERKVSDEKIKNLAKFPSENPNAVLRVSKSGQIIYSNKASKMILDSPELKSGKLSGELAIRVQQSFNSDLSSELEITHKNRIYMVAITPILDADYTNLYASDITERKIAENELRKAEEQYRTLFEAASSPILTLKPDGKVIYANPATEKMTGYSIDVLTSGDFNFFSIVHPEYRSQAQKYAERKYQGEKSPPTEVKMLSSNGDTIDVLCDCQLINLEGNNSLQVVITDITGLKEVDRLKSAFISTASHELRTPLTSIIGYSDTLLTHDDLEENVKSEFLEIILDEGKRLKNIMDDMLDLTRIESGKIKLKKENISIRDLFSLALERQSIEITDKKISINISIHPENLEIICDNDKILQAIDNLLSNAVKFSHPEGEITINAYQNDETVFIEIKDYGIGISEEHLSNIFERFYRVKDVPIQNQGTGLGLSIVKDIITLHDGEIKVDSEVGRGSTFSIMLPRTERGG